MPRIRVRDIEIYYEVQGSGPRLLFIGGSGGDLRNKPGVFDGPLIKRFEVLAFDQRGLGRSDAPAGPYSMADYGEDAAGLIEAPLRPAAGNELPSPSTSYRISRTANARFA